MEYLHTQTFPIAHKKNGNFLIFISIKSFIYQMVNFEIFVLSTHMAMIRKYIRCKPYKLIELTQKKPILLPFFALFSKCFLSSTWIEYFCIIVCPLVDHGLGALVEGVGTIARYGE